MKTADRPVIGFLTDFGLDGAAATCRGVMLSICREAQIVDVSHTVPKYAIREGAFILRASLPFLPVGVHVGVVDPGVGTDRRPVAIRTERGDLLVGPDNGLLVPAAEALGGVDEARELTNRDLWLAPTSATFHARDIFAPVAAHLAGGDAAFDSVGPTIADLVRLPAAEARAGADVLETEITYVDSFGNLRLAGGPPQLVVAFGEVDHGRRFAVSIGPARREIATFARSFGHVAAGETVFYVDSTGDLALGTNQGNLATRIGAEAGHAVRIEPG